MRWACHPLVNPAGLQRERGFDQITPHKEENGHIS